MRTLGLIGGMTWHSTVDYYRLINEGVQERLGGSHSAELLLLSIDFEPGRAAPGEGRLGGHGPADGRRGQALEAPGPRPRHLHQHDAPLAGDIQQADHASRSSISPTRRPRRSREPGLETVGLLGTRYTMEMDFYRGRLEKEHGLKVLIPEEPGRTIVHDVIYKELTYGKIREESRAGLRRDHRGPGEARRPGRHPGLHGDPAPRQGEGQPRARSSTRRPSTPRRRSISRWADRFRQ